MPFPLLSWVVGAGAVLLGLAGWFLYVRYLHPAWRKERRVIRACEEAFDEGDYKLVRLCVDLGKPSIGDLFPRPLGLPEVPRYFTYNIEVAEGEEPDFSDMSKQEISVVRRYRHRNVGNIPHHGRSVIRPESTEELPLQSERQGAGAWARERPVSKSTLMPGRSSKSISKDPSKPFSKSALVPGHSNTSMDRDPSKRVWRVFYTRARAEKKCETRLDNGQIEVLVPKKTEILQWSDRKEEATVPLFRNYLFARVDEKDRLRVLRTKGIVRCVRLDGKLARLREETAKQLKRTQSAPDRLSAADLRPQVGPTVTITNGPEGLRGLTGEVKEHRGTTYLLVRVEAIRQAVMVEVRADWVQSGSVRV